MELEFELANGFEERGKTGVPEEKPLSIQLSQLNLESHTEGPTNCTDSDKY